MSFKNSLNIYAHNIIGNIGDEYDTVSGCVLELDFIASLNFLIVEEVIWS